MKKLYALALLSCVGVASGDEIVLQNDTLADGSQAFVCPCFASNEEAAVWLTSPCDGNIVAIQIFWRSFLGGSEPSVEESILIYQGGNFPVPGPIKKELLAPALTDGGLNEFRFEDQDQTVPISVPVSAGETFVVSLRFFNTNVNDLFAGTVVSDTTGCLPGKNAVKVNGTTWQSACSLGVSGNWVIRAVVDCGTGATGAVCLPDGSCADGLTQDDADLLGGQFRGVGTLCADVACVGACFVPSTGNCLQFDKATCDAIGGQWQGPGTTDCNACPADLTGDGKLNFFDVSAYIGLFNKGNAGADINDDGDLNFFDVSAYLQLFNQGCP